MEPTETSHLLVSDDGTKDSEEKSTEQLHKPPRLITVEPVVVIYHMAFMAAQPLLQQYVYKYLSIEYNITQIQDTGQCDLNITQDEELDPAYEILEDEVAFWNILIVSGTLMPSVLVTLILGAFSETLGRKLALIPPIAGTFLGGVILFCTIFWNLPLWTIMIPVLLSGVSGGMGCVSLGAFAYMCDISSSEKRFVRIFIVELSNGIGTLLAHVTTGYLIKYTGFLFPVLVGAVLQLLILLYSILFLEETYKPKAKAASVNCPDFKALVSIYIIEGSKKRRTQLIICLLLTLFIVFFEQGIYNILTFYFLDPPFCWEADLIGLFNGVVFVVKSVGGGILTVLLIRRLQETTLLLIGCLSYIVYFLLVGFANGPALAFTGKSHPRELTLYRWACYQMHKSRVAHAPGMPGAFSPPGSSKGNR